MTAQTIVSAPLGVAGEYPSHLAELAKGGIHIFANKTERDAMWDELKIDNKTVALLKDGDNNYPSWYIWTGTEWEFAGYFGGMAIADVDGALTHIDSTAVLGPDFKMQAAGDTDNGVLVMLSDKVKQELETKATEAGKFNLTVEMTPDSQYGSSLVNTIKTETPLMVEDDPNTEHSVKMYIKHDAYEPLHKPSFLAYLADETEVVGKFEKQIDAKSHRNGAIWFDNVVKPDGMYIHTDKANKKYTIQEADTLDPNVTGGTDYLVSFRIAMKGVAPNDGFVRAYLYNESVDPFEPRGHLTDVNGHPLAVQKSYKAGEELGVLEVVGVVNAKGMKSFTCHVADTFENDMVVLEDRTQGATGLMMQAITSEEKTGNGLQQFEIDTAQNLVFSSHYLGEDRASISYIVSRDQPMETGGS